MSRAWTLLALALLAAACSGDDGQATSSTASGQEPGREGGAPSAALVATEEERGSFMTPCEHSHSGPDDPIVHAGHTGASHLHEFFGATTTDASSTAESLLAAETTCRSAADRSAYWVPALFVDGEQVQPQEVIAYYRVPLGADARQVHTPPNGLEMIAGDQHATGPQDSDVVHWSCGSSGERSPVPTMCWPGAQPLFRLTFAPCWDGENLRSPDHHSHLARLGDDGSCPESHPVLLPELTLEVRYPDTGGLASPGPQPDVALASGSIPVTGSHGDALLAWDEEFITGEVETCLRDNLYCDVVQAGSRLTINHDG